MADADDDEFVTDEQLELELEDDAELELQYRVIPMGIRMAYDRLSRGAYAVQKRLEYLMLLLFAADLVSEEDIGFDVHAFIKGEIAAIKLQIVRRDMVTEDTSNIVEFIEDVMEMREDESRVGEAAEMLARLKALGGDIHAFHRERAQRAARPSAPEKGCVVCREADPVGNVSADCAHPPSLCEECLPRVPDACPICRATAPCTSEADAAAAAAAPPADPPAAD